MTNTSNKPAKSSSMKTSRPGLGQIAARVMSVHGLLVLLILLFLLFSVLRPHTFLTVFNIQSILSDQSIFVLVALAETIVVVAKQFDLSVGYGIGMGQILVIGFQTRQHLPWPAAAGLVLLIGLAVGFINGLLVTRAHIDSFIATLGVGTLLFGISEWYTGGSQVLGSLPSAFSTISGKVFGIPLPAIYVLVVGIALWIVFEFLPIGRYLYVLGSNPKAAELAGISGRRYVLLAFTAAGLLVGFAGVVLGSRLGVGQSSVGPEYLLPAFVGALLGATSVHPGRANVWGTVIAVFLLGTAVAGLQQFGAQFYTQPIFSGALLVVAVAVAGYVSRRRQRAAAAARGLGAEPPPTAGDATAPGTRPVGEAIK